MTDGKWIIIERNPLCGYHKEKYHTKCVFFLFVCLFVCLFFVLFWFFWGGVIIDNEINWKDHISYIAGKVSRGIGMLIKARKYLQREALLTIYYTFIYPYFTYCDHIWGTTYISHLGKLIKLQNAVLRIMWMLNGWTLLHLYMENSDYLDWLTLTNILFACLCFASVIIKFLYHYIPFCT